MKQKKGFVKWIQSGKVNRRLCMIVFMFAPLALLFTFTYLPFAEMVQFSFYDMKYIGERTFVGLENYVEVFSREDCFNALKLSLYYMGASFVQLALALYFASILSFKIKGAGVLKVFVFPYLVCGIAVGFIFKFFYTRGFVLDTVLQWCGFELDNLPYWLKDTNINNISWLQHLYGVIWGRTWFFLSERSCLWILLFMKQQRLMVQVDGKNSVM